MRLPPNFLSLSIAELNQRSLHLKYQLLLLKALHRDHKVSIYHLWRYGWGGRGRGAPCHSLELNRDREWVPPKGRRKDFIKCLMGFLADAKEPIQVLNPDVSSSDFVLRPEMIHRETLKTDMWYGSKNPTPAIALQLTDEGVKQREELTELLEAIRERVKELRAQPEQEITCRKTPIKRAKGAPALRGTKASVRKLREFRRLVIEVEVLSCVLEAGRFVLHDLYRMPWYRRTPYADRKVDLIQVVNGLIDQGCLERLQGPSEAEEFAVLQPGPNLRARLERAKVELSEAEIWLSAVVDNRKTKPLRLPPEVPSALKDPDMVRLDQAGVAYEVAVLEHLEMFPERNTGEPNTLDRLLSLDHDDFLGVLSEKHKRAVLDRMVRRRWIKHRRNNYVEQRDPLTYEYPDYWITVRGRWAAASRPDLIKYRQCSDRVWSKVPPMGW